MTSTINSPTSDGTGSAQLAEALNEDLRFELQSVIQYVQYAAMVRGPFRMELSELFRHEIEDELKHAQFLAEKVAALGGTPATVPHEVPAATDPRQMLEQVRDAEADAIRRYTERAEQADRAGETALKVDLEDMIRDETTHREEVEKILEGWR